MADLKEHIDNLRGLIEEFGLDRAKLCGDEWSVEFARDEPRRVAAVAAEPAEAPRPRAEKRPTATGPAGVPINSPTTGIYYSSPNPGSPPFVNVGDTVEAGQVIGLIEAMKVFNEITATLSGKVVRVAAQNGQLVQPGDPILYIG